MYYFGVGILFLLWGHGLINSTIPNARILISFGAYNTAVGALLMLLGILLIGLGIKTMRRGSGDGQQ